jgi:hypothetical protein
MKYLFSILFCFALLHQGRGQEMTEAQHFYGESLNGYLEFFNSGKPLIIQIVPNPKVARLYMYDPKTQKLLLTVRAKVLVEKKNGISQTHYLLDSNFVYTHTDKQKVVYDAAAKKMTGFDTEVLKAFDCGLKNKKNRDSIVYTTYYTNGKAKSRTVYAEKGMTLSIFKATLTGKGVMSIFSPEYDDVIIQEQFYPNGKLYWSEKKQPKKAVENAFSTKNIAIFDSTGKALDAQKYWYEHGNMKKGLRLSFARNGRLVFFEKTPDEDSGYSERREFDAQNGDLQQEKLDYLDTKDKKYLMILKAKNPGNLFMNDVVYTHLAEGFTYNKTELTTPLFSLTFDSLGHTLAIVTVVKNTNWGAKICPLPPKPLVIGKRKGVLPDGEWRIYAVDSLAKQTHLAVVANFDKGLPNGLFAAFSVSGDTLVEAVYRQGILETNKYYAAYMRSNFADQYFVDSLWQMNVALQKRAIKQNEKQHALYRADPKNIWQRDTIFSIYQTDYSIKNRSVVGILRVEEQLSPDSNSLVRVKYRYLDGFNDTISTVLYHKKTHEIDSIATIYDNHGELLWQFDAQAQKGFEWTTKKYENAAAYYTEMPNDSVLICTKKERYGDKIILQTIDSFYHTPSFRTFAPSKIQLKGYFAPNTRDIKTLYQMRRTEGREVQPFWYNFEINALNPLSTRTERDSLYGRELYFVTDKGKERIDTKALYDKKAQKAAVEWRISQENSKIYARNYADEQGDAAKNGIEKCWDGSENTTTVKRFVAGEVQEVERFDAGGRLQAHFVLKKTNVNKQIIRDMYAEFFDEKGRLYHTETQRMKRKGSGDFDCFQTNGDLIDLKYYTQDSLGGLYLQFEISRQADSTYFMRSWYASGKPQVVYAHYGQWMDLGCRERLSLSLNLKTKIDDIMHLLHHFGLFAFLVQYENGKVWAQGYNWDAYCIYDENGKIKAENLPKTTYPDNKGLLFFYPDETNKASCAWENLPLQEGKMANGRRVGKWKGFERTAQKTLKYEMNYDSLGYMDGKMLLYDSIGQVVADYTYKKGRKNGVLHFYKNKTITEKMYYSNDVFLRTEFFNTNGVLYKKISDTKGVQTTMDYWDNGSILKQKNIAFHSHNERGEVLYYKIDSVFSSTGKLLSANFSDSERLEISTTCLENKTYQTTKKINSHTFCATQAAYLKAEGNMLGESYGGSDAGFVVKKNEPINPKIQANMQYIRIKTPLKDISSTEETPDFVLTDSLPSTHLAKVNELAFRDNYGNSFLLQSKVKNEPLYVNVHADTGAIAAEYRPIYYNPNFFFTSHGGRHLRESVFDAWNKNLKSKVSVFAAHNLYTTVKYPAALLHPAQSKADAVLLIGFNDFTIGEGYPHKYMDEEGFSYLKNTENKANIAEYYANTATDTLAFIGGYNPMSATQAYEIGKTGVVFVPTNMQMVVGAPITAELPHRGYTYDADYTPIKMPHHQTILTQKNGYKTKLCDAFLRQKAIRVLVTDAEFTLPCLPNQTLLAQNILLDKAEINGEFVLTANAESHQKVQKYLAAQKISLIIEPQAVAENADTEGKTTAYKTTYYFRYERP